jgi:hypothetical protein
MRIGHEGRNVLIRVNSEDDSNDNKKDTNYENDSGYFRAKNHPQHRRDRERWRWRRHVRYRYCGRAAKKR